jgi:hypothetical protein
MSTFPRRPEELYEEVADHLGPEFGETRQACRDTMAKSTALRYLAHYSSAVFDFGLDALGDPPPPPDALPGTTRRDELKRLGRQLGSTITNLDRSLQEVRTGRLIRTVLQTEEGAVFCDSVVPSENVVGLVVDRSATEHPEVPLASAPDVRAADQAVAELAGALRARVRLPSLNPGGWESAELAEPLPSTGPGPAPCVTVLAGPGEETDRLVAACVRAARPDDLHVVAYCSQGELPVLVDHLDHPSLSPFFTQIAVETRRRFYQGFSRELGTLAHRLNRTTSTALGGVLVRLVLDVEMGAIFFYRLRPGDYLVGVTIDQNQVRGADDRMAALALELR